MITTVLRRSLFDASRQTLSAPPTSINAVLFHHFTPAAARVSDLTAIGPTASSDVKSGLYLPPTTNPSREFHIQSGPSEFRASMVSPAGFAISESSVRGIGDSESVGSSSGDGLAISDLGISPEIVKALRGRGIEKFFPIQKEAEESTSKIKGTKICIAIRSFDNPEKQAWCLPPHTRKVAMPDSRVLYTVLRSPHVDKKSREQFEMRFKKRFLVIKAQSHELSKKLFWLKRYRILGAQYELQFHCKTRLDMTPVLGYIDGSTPFINETNN